MVARMVDSLATILIEEKLVLKPPSSRMMASIRLAMKNAEV